MAPLAIHTSFYTSLLKCLSSLLFARLYTPQSHPIRDLSGQNAIVTGANSGIGLSIAISLAKQHATVYLACRNLTKGAAAVDEVIRRAGAASKGRVFCWQVDVGDLDSVTVFCEKWAKEGRDVDMLVHNAGIADVPSGTRTKDEKGRDVIYVTNFLGSWLMTRLLEENLSNDARVVFTSSTGSYSGASVLGTDRAAEALSPTSSHGRLSGLLKQVIGSTQKALGLTPSSAPAYALSKAQQVLFATLLQQHFSAQSGNKRSAHAFTPGFTSTPIFDKFDVDWQTWISNPLFAGLKASEKWIAVDTDEGAKTGAWLASSGDELDGGGFWEWGCRRTSLVDFMRGSMGEDRWRSACVREWMIWEENAGIDWKIDI